MILGFPKFKIGDEVYCYIDGIVFLTTIKDVYMINEKWNYNISGENYNGSEELCCPESVLSKKVNDKKVKAGTYVE